MLDWTIYISFAAAALLLVIPARYVRTLAISAAIAGMILAVSAIVGVNGAANQGELKNVRDALWVPQLNIHYHLAADGVSLTLILLTAIASVAGVLFSWNIKERVNEFFALYFVLIGGVYGVFLSFDLFLLLVFYEIAIIPKYFLIAIWGSTRREYGAMKLALYSFIGSAMVIVGLIAAFVVSGGTTWNLVELAKFPFPVSFQIWVFLLVFLGFAILAGIWPLHTWAPTGHVAAPTAASMLLAGVVMKLGAYGALRVAMTLFPAGLDYWRYWLATLAVIGIVSGAMVALVQNDFKFVIGYSSVSHMGFVLLGLMTLSQIGLTGAVLQMFSHGIVAGLLFAVVGRMVYERTHTRDLGKLETLSLSKALPFAALTFVVAAAASMGLPGFSGFIAELQVLVGGWKSGGVLQSLTIVAGLGIIVGVAYTLRIVVRAFFSDAKANPQLHEPLVSISWPERAGALLLLTSTIIVGLYPRLLLDLISPTFNSPLFERMWKGGV